MPVLAGEWSRRVAGAGLLATKDPPSSWPSARLGPNRYLTRLTRAKTGRITNFLIRMSQSRILRHSVRDPLATSCCGVTKGTSSSRSTWTSPAWRVGNACSTRTARTNRTITYGVRSTQSRQTTASLATRRNTCERSRDGSVTMARSSSTSGVLTIVLARGRTTNGKSTITHSTGTPGLSPLGSIMLTVSQ